jgi:cyanosortase A-associated protein
MSLKIKYLSDIFQNSQILILVIISFLIFSSLGKLFIISVESASSSFTFPSVVALPDWQSLESTSINRNALGTSQAPTFFTGIKYRFAKDNLGLDVDMNYIAGGLGDTREYTKIYQGFLHEATSPIHKHTVGYYYQYTYQGRAYLSTCINPHGSSTVNPQQFQKARFADPDWPRHVLPVLLGQESFWDDRCLWTQLSIPLKNLSTEQAYQALESAFFPWFQRWSKNFPDS